MTSQPELISIHSTEGMEVKLWTLGARIQSFSVPYLDSRLEIAETSEDFNQYTDYNIYSGAIIGAYANRIANAQFKLKGAVYNLDKNQEENTLHGGKSGLHSRVWKLIEHNQHSAILQTEIKDLEDGFPGNRTFHIKYEFSDDELQLTFKATTDKTTHINMTNHAYFNLDTQKHLGNHLFMISSKGALELNSNKIPTGNIIPPVGDFNFFQFKSLDQNKFDHNFILSNPNLNHISAAVYCTTTDLTLEVSTDQPGLQFYTGHGHYFAMETQHFPDTPNQPKFPSTIINAGETYLQRCGYRIVS